MQGCGGVEVGGPQADQLGGRPADQPVTVQGQLAGERQRAGPAGVGDLVGRPLRALPGPAPEQHAIAVDQRLRGVEGRSGVHRAARLGHERQSGAGLGQVPDQVAHPGQVVGAVDVPPLGQQQHPPSPQLEQVRALPDVRRHHRRRHRVGDGEQRTQQLPVVQVVAAVDQQLRIAVVVTGPLDGVAVVTEPEDERVAHLRDGRVVGSADLEDRVLTPLAQRPVAAGHGDPGVPGVLADRCVDRRRHPVVVDHAARPAAVRVDRSGRPGRGRSARRSSAAGRSSSRGPSARCRAWVRPGCAGRRRGSGRRRGRRRSGR